MMFDIFGKKRIEELTAQLEAERTAKLTIHQGACSLAQRLDAAEEVHIADERNINSLRTMLEQMRDLWRTKGTTDAERDFLLAVAQSMAATGARMSDVQFKYHYRKMQAARRKLGDAEGWVK